MTPAYIAPPGRHIGFVSTRLAGTDGVSLETAKWAAVLEGMGHTCFYFSGQNDRPAERSRVAPEAFFGHETIAAINQSAFAMPAAGAGRPPILTRRIHELREHLKAELRAFVQQFAIELLISENALTIPMNIPLGLALTEFIAESGLPVIAHHHDFYWERQRFLINCVGDYLAMAFPPVLPSVTHVVINSPAARELALRTGVAALVVPNVMDFAHPPALPDDYSADLRTALDVAGDELLILQPTRVIPRKGIEAAIELTRRLELKACLVISHASGDEGDSYETRLREYAALLGVPVRFEATLIGDTRGVAADGRKRYSLDDVYPYADLVTYPSLIEGFGNAFLEAVYFRRPLVVNNYPIYAADIKPKGFRVVEFDGFISEATVDATRRVLADAALAGAMADHNYRLAERFFSYEALENRLRFLLDRRFGE